ncbi:MAG: membrane dipeptidase [Firmicutes bacterium]|nr:membrane dipeptidase [Bacillota bacterium]
MIVIDAHCDTLTTLKKQNRTLGERSNVGHVDLHKLRDGGVNVQFFAIYIEPIYGEERGISRTLEIVDLFYQEYKQNSKQMELAVCSNEIRNITRAGKVAAVLTIEGGEALGGKLYMLPIYYKLGVRCITLTWNVRNSIADGVSERFTGGGLTKFGREVVQEMNKLGMLIDVSHISEAGFWDVIDLSSDPIIATHSNCSNLCQHPRNLTDGQIKAIAKTNGVIGLTLVPQFIAENDPGLDKFLDHIDYIANLVGTDFIGVGSDFDGCDHTISEISNASEFHKISTGLSKRGYCDEDVYKIMGGNFMGVMDRVFK